MSVVDLFSGEALVRSRGDLSRPRVKREEVGGLKYYPRLGVWRASNVKLDPKSLRSWSYDWWLMSCRIGPYLVFNEYGYSNSTRKHQSKVRSWLWKKGYLFVTVESPHGLQDLESSRRYYLNRIAELEALCARPKTRAYKNQERRERIYGLKAKLELVNDLIEIRGAV
jgi:hypothetical protein